MYQFPNIFRCFYDSNLVFRVDKTGVYHKDSSRYEEKMTTTAEPAFLLLVLRIAQNLMNPQQHITI